MPHSDPSASSLLERARQAQALVRSDSATSRRLADTVLAEAGPEDRLPRCCALLARATHAHRDSRHTDAQQDTRTALALGREIADQETITRSLNLLGLIHHALGDDRAAIEYFHDSIRNAEANSDERGRCGATANIAMVMHSQGDQEGALKVYRDLVTQPGIISNLQFLSQTRHNIAQTSWDLGRDLPASAELFIQAAAGKKELGDHWSLALTLCSLSGVQRDLGRFPEAKATLDEVATLVHSEASHELRFFHRLNLGMWLAAEKNPARNLDTAQTELETALTFAIATKAPDLEARAREYLAGVRQAAGRHAEAYDELKASAKLQQQVQKDESKRRIERLKIAFDAEQAQRDAAHERKRREEAETYTAEIQEQNRRLETLNRQKSDIIGLIVHDLRGPLATALELTEELAANPRDSANVTQLANDLLSSHRQMLDLTRAILDLEAIESGTLWSKLADVDFGVLFAAVQHAHANDLKAKGLRVEVTLPATSCGWHGPVLQIERAVENLFSNAVKYTPRGGQITLTAAPVNTGVEILVSDSGPGIAPAQRSRLFDKFATLGTPATGGESTHGLGLYLAQCCARHAGGEIRYEDAPAGGATFVLALPTRTTG